MEISYIESFKLAVAQAKYKWLCEALRLLKNKQVDKLLAIVEGVKDVP